MQVTSCSKDAHCSEEAESTVVTVVQPIGSVAENRLAHLSSPHADLLAIEQQTEVLRRNFRFTAYKFKSREWSFIRMFDDYLTEVLQTVQDVSVELPLYENCLRELTQR